MISNERKMSFGLFFENYYFPANWSSFEANCQGSVTGFSVCNGSNSLLGNFENIFRIVFETASNNLQSAKMLGMVVCTPTQLVFF